MPDTLGEIDVLFGGDFSALDSAMDQALARARRGGDQQGDEFARSFAQGARGGILALTGTYQQLKGEIAMVAGTLGEVTGVNSAAVYETQLVAFSTLLRDGNKAKSLLDDLYSLGSRTPFNSDQLVQFGRQLLANGFAAEGLAKKIGTVADAAAGLGLRTEGMGRLTYVLGQVRAGGIQGDDLRQFKNAGVNLAEVVGLALGQKIQDAKSAMESLRGMSPERQSETILRGLEMRFGGMAEKLGTTTFAGLSQNLTEKLSMAMRPTGDLALSGGVKATTGVLGETIGNFQKLNTTTGGVAGLLGLFAIGIPVLRDFYTQVSLARAALRNLGGEGVIGGAGRPIMVSGGPIYVTGAVAPTSGGALVPVGAAGGSLGTAGGAATGGLIARIGTGLLGFLKNPFTIGGIMALAGGALSMSGNKDAQNIGGLLGNVGTGVTIGAAIGSIIPGIGTAIGAAIGGVGGLGVSLYDRISKDNQGTTTDTAAERTAKATEEVARSLKELRVEMIGGGSRTRNAGSRIELEYAMMSYQRAAFGAGIG